MQIYETSAVVQQYSAILRKAERDKHSNTARAKGKDLLTTDYKDLTADRLAKVANK